MKSMAKQKSLAELYRRSMTLFATALVTSQLLLGCRANVSQVADDQQPLTGNSVNAKVYYGDAEGSSAGTPVLILKKPGTENLTSLMVTGVWAYDPLNKSTNIPLKPTNSLDRVGATVLDTTGQYYMLDFGYEMIMRGSETLLNNQEVTNTIKNPRAIIQWTAVFGSETRVFKVGDIEGLSALVTPQVDPLVSPNPNPSTQPVSKFAFDETIQSLMVSEPDSAESDVRVLDKLGDSPKVIFELSAEWCGPCQSLATEVSAAAKDGKIGKCTIITLMHDTKNSFKNRDPWSRLAGHIFKTDSRLDTNFNLISDSGSAGGYPTVVGVDRNERKGSQISATVDSIESFCNQ